jgi:hypothetical protein
MNQPATIDTALRFIPADDREAWILCGMAIKAELGDSGYSIWDDWSQTAGNYKERDSRDVWRSFKDGNTRIGTLFHLAKENGYRPSKKATESPALNKTSPSQRRNTDKYAAEIWLRADCSDKAVADHPYAVTKGIDWAAGAGRATVTGRVVGKEADCIIVPIRNIEANKVVAVQCINAEGDKQTFGSMSGHGLVLGNTLDKSIPWYVTEGWASGISMVFHHHRGNAVCGVAFGKSNMERVAQAIADHHHPKVVTILQEVDE